jgi:hypothetical protein
MKIAILAVRDTGGTAYTLAHAINNVYPNEHQAISVRSTNNFIDYPTIADMNSYNRKDIRELTYKADVVVFLGATAPFYEAFKLSKAKMRCKKKILLCMGSEWRWGRTRLIAQAKQLLEKYKIVLGGADMFIQIPIPQPDGSTKLSEEVGDDIGYLPVVRSFKDISRYSLVGADEEALKAFVLPPKKVVFTHAPTSEVSKGSDTFYRVATRVMQAVPNMTFQTIRSRPWVTTLSALSKTDVLFDQAPPFPTAYGALSVEAGIFHVPSISRVAPECAAFIKKHTGLDTPYISFKDEDDLIEKTLTLATSEKHRRLFGDLNYNYCKALHDEKPVVDRFFSIVEKM